MKKPTAIIVIALGVFFGLLLWTGVNALIGAMHASAEAKAKQVREQAVQTRADASSRLIEEWATSVRHWTDQIELMRHDDDDLLENVRRKQFYQDRASEVGRAAADGEVLDAARSHYNTYLQKSNDYRTYGIQMSQEDINWGRQLKFMIDRLTYEAEE